MPVLETIPDRGSTPDDEPGARVPLAVLLTLRVLTVKPGKIFFAVFVRKAVKVAELDPVFVTSTDPANTSVMVSVTLTRVPSEVLKPVKLKVCAQFVAVGPNDTVWVTVPAEAAEAHAIMAAAVKPIVRALIIGVPFLD